MKTSITAHARLELIGLLTLAKRYNRQLEDVKAAALDVLAITHADEQPIGNPADHVGDAVYSDYDVDQLLQRLHITVEEGR